MEIQSIHASAPLWDSHCSCTQMGPGCPSRGLLEGPAMTFHHSPEGAHLSLSALHHCLQVAPPMGTPLLCVLLAQVALHSYQLQSRWLEFSGAWKELQRLLHTEGQARDLTLQAGPAFDQRFVSDSQVLSHTQSAFIVCTQGSRQGIGR